MGKQPQNDLRYRKTEEAICQAFREMLAEMDYSQITIQALSERARINRKTFYLHYPSIDDLLYKLKWEFLQRYLEPVAASRLPDDLEVIVRNCYQFSEYSDSIDEKLLNTEGRFPVSQASAGSEKQPITTFNDSYTAYPADKYPFLMAFVGGSLTEIYRQWVKDGRKIPMEEMIRLTVRLISQGLSG